MEEYYPFQTRIFCSQFTDTVKSSSINEIVLKDTGKVDQCQWILVLKDKGEVNQYRIGELVLEDTGKVDQCQWTSPEGYRLGRPVSVN